jgi:predicted transcriptional regulator
MKEGGYYHIYKPSDVTTIEDNVDYRIREIEAALNRIRKKFKEDIKKMAVQ